MKIDLIVLGAGNRQAQLKIGPRQSAAAWNGRMIACIARPANRQGRAVDHSAEFLNVLLIALRRLFIRLEAILFKTQAEIDFIDFGEWDAKAQSAADPVDDEVFRSCACGYKRLLRIVVSARELSTPSGVKYGLRCTIEKARAAREVSTLRERSVPLPKILFWDRLPPSISFSVEEKPA